MTILPDMLEKLKVARQSLAAIIGGVIYGTLPVIKASRLNPTDALRCE